MRIRSGSPKADRPEAEARPLGRACREPLRMRKYHTSSRRAPVGGLFKGRMRVANNGVALWRALLRERLLLRLNQAVRTLSRQRARHGERGQFC